MHTKTAAACSPQKPSTPHYRDLLDCAPPPIMVHILEFCSVREIDGVRRFQTEFCTKHIVFEYNVGDELTTHYLILSRGGDVYNIVGIVSSSDIVRFRFDVSASSFYFLLSSL